MDHATVTKKVVSVFCAFSCRFSEANNNSSKYFFKDFSKTNPVPDMESCNQGLGIGTFDFQSMKK
jgi:hypothetical protein